MFSRSAGHCTCLFTAATPQVRRAVVYHDALSFHSRLFSQSTITHAKLQVGDRILLRWQQSKTSKRKITHPLREDGETVVDNHIIKHSELIGQESDTRITKISKDGLRKITLFARHPSLDEFTSLSPRRVAPIYATYASTIASLLDIHPELPNDENHPNVIGGPSLQILEAGTGHGSLTLHLAREIIAANPPIPKSVLPQPSKKAIFKAGEEMGDLSVPDSEALTQWRSQRRAVVNTVDIDPGNRSHADQLIRSFRGAIYWPHIDFHVGDVKDWIAERQATNDKPFLDKVILDMPGVEEYIETVIPAIKDRGHLLVFVPQITQIATCVQEIVTMSLGLRLEKVVELGDSVSTGRLWDVRMATLKNVKPSNHAQSTPGSSEVESGSTPKVGTIPPMVCRPTVGEMTRGGGFVGLWKKVPAGSPA